MSTVVRIPFSSSQNGKQIGVARVATLGTPIHSAAGGSTIDYITLRACCITTLATLLTIENGGTSDSDKVQILVPGQAGQITVFDRKLIGSSFNLTAFAGLSSVINLDGWIDRVS